MILYMVRHGITEWNATGRSQGQTDVPLSELGRAQARTLAPRFSDARLCAAYASDLSRASETAALALAGLELTAIETPALREIALGEWEGLHLDTIAANYPELRAQWQADPARCRFPGGECLADVQRRVVDFLDGVRRRHAYEDRVAIFGHGFATLTYLCHAIELPLSSFRHLWLDPTAVSEVRFSRSGRTTLRLLNCTAHLSALEEPATVRP